MGGIMSQEEYHYSDRWSKKAVNLLIETLSGAALYGDWEYGTNMTLALEKAKSMLKSEFGLVYNDVELQEALQKLRERYDVWKKLSCDPRVLICKWSGRVSTKPSVWESLLQEDARVKWYGDEGESAFDDLEVIFENPFKGKEDFVFLGEVSGIHTNIAGFDQVEIAPLPVAPTPSRNPNLIDVSSPNIEQPIPTNLVFTPNPGVALYYI